MTVTPLAYGMGLQLFGSAGIYRRPRGPMATKKSAAKKKIAETEEKKPAKEKKPIATRVRSNTLVVVESPATSGKASSRYQPARSAKWPGACSVASAWA